MSREYKFPEVLGDLLEEKNLLQTHLACEMGLSRWTVNKWLNFKSIPSVFNLMELAEKFNVSIDYLIYGAENEKRKQDSTTGNARTNNRMRI